MKKLAARDFEDILQVSLDCVVLSIYASHPISVLHTLLRRVTACAA